jgi:hypothetical protein
MTHDTTRDPPVIRRPYLETVPVHLAPPDMTRLRAWMARRGLVSRSEAIRQLLENVLWD